MSPIYKCILSIYLSIPIMLPPFTWVKINHYINCKHVLFPILNDGPQWGLNCEPLDLQSPALPSELSAILQYWPMVPNKSCQILESNQIFRLKTKVTMKTPNVDDEDVRRMRKSKFRITIEPYLFIAIFGLMLTYLTLQNFMLDKACRVNLNFTGLSFFLNVSF